jgi:hypothetical protein
VLKQFFKEFKHTEDEEEEEEDRAKGVTRDSVVRIITRL